MRATSSATPREPGPASLNSSYRVDAIVLSIVPESLLRGQGTGVLGGGGAGAGVGGPEWNAMPAGSPSTRRILGKEPRRPGNQPCRTSFSTSQILAGVRSVVRTWRPNRGSRHAHLAVTGERPAETTETPGWETGVFSAEGPNGSGEKTFDASPYLQTARVIVRFSRFQH